MSTWKIWVPQKHWSCMAGKRSSIKLTQKYVDAIPFPAHGQVLIFDSEMAGFGIRVTPNAKTFIAQSRVEGKVVRSVVGVYGKDTLKQARDKAQANFVKMREGVSPIAERKAQQIKTMTLEDLHQKFLDERGQSLRPATIKLYNGAMRRCFSDWQTKSLDSITKEMVEKRHFELSNAHGPRGKGEAHANQAMRILRTLMNYAISSEIISTNPVKRLSDKKLWNRNVRRKGIVSRADLPKWFEAVLNLENETIRDYLLLILFTGLRRTEAAQIRWSDVDLRNRTLKISADVTKNHEEHEVPLSDYVFNMLQARASKHADSGVQFVFPGPGKGGYLVESKFSMARVKSNSGVEFTLHDLRRTFLTILESLDVGAYTIKRLANHKNAADVTAGYLIADIERLRKPMQDVATRILDYASDV